MRKISDDPSGNVSEMSKPSKVQNHQKSGITKSPESLKVRNPKKSGIPKKDSGLLKISANRAADITAPYPHTSPVFSLTGSTWLPSVPRGSIQGSL